MFAVTSCPTCTLAPYGDGDAGCRLAHHPAPASTPNDARLDFELFGPDTRSDLGAVDAAVRFELVYGVSTKLASGVQADS